MNEIIVRLYENIDRNNSTYRRSYHIGKVDKGLRIEASINCEAYSGQVKQIAQAEQ